MADERESGDAQERGDERMAGGEALPAAAFVAAILGAIAFAVVYLRGADTQLMGIALFVSLGGIGVGLVSWAKRSMTPAEPEVEPRGRLVSTDEEIEAFHADFQVGEHEFERRGMLTKLLVGAVSAFGLAALFPFLSLGPPAGKSFKQTPYKKGTRLVDEKGRPVRADAVNTDGVITVFPEGDVGDEFAQALLIGLRTGQFQAPPGRESWTPDDLACFSKVCTHAGCPVGLYEADQGLLLCPCHQSTFDVNRACEVVFGPAATPLPQLPLAIDADGFVVAAGDFSDPPGPAFWDQDRP